MKILYIFLLLFVVTNVNGQRRTTPKTDTAEVEQSHTPPRGRGRSRFAATSEYTQINEPTRPPPSDPTSRRLTSRKRVSETTERRSTRPIERPVKTSYEVDEVINESPIDSFKRQSKPRVLTESHFESIHAPKKKLIDPIQALNETPAPTLALEELFKAVESSTNNAGVTDTSASQPETTNDIGGSEDVLGTTFKSNLLDISSETSKGNEITREFTKTSPVTTPKPTESRRNQNGARRSNLRSRISSSETEETVSQAPRIRSRMRPTRRPEDTSSLESQAVTARAVQASRNSRRRVESSTQAEVARKGPSVFVAEETQEVSRIRPGRRVAPTTPEKVTLDLPNGRSRDASRKRTVTPATTTTEKIEDDSRRRPSSRFQSRNSVPSAKLVSKPRARSSTVPTINEFPVPTASTKGRFRARDFPPIIDEQKLEVLPLFEAEPKTVRPVIKPRSRSRTRSINNAQENIQMSATENDLKFTPNSNEIPKISVSRTQTVNVETRTETSVKRKVGSRAPVVKESVVAEVNEVTSKRTFTRRKPSEGVKIVKVKGDKPKVTVTHSVSTSRGKKKSEVNLVQVKKKGSSEEIDESDNYPEPFKALIQAKKNNKESRPSTRPLSTIPTVTSIVTTTTEPSTSVSSSTANTEDDILDNEVDPKPSTSTSTTTTTTTTSKPPAKPSRRRFSLTTKYPEPQSTTTTTKRPTFPARKSSKVVRSTAQPTTTSPKEHRFHAKFTSTVSPRSEGVVKYGRGTLSPRGLYSSRKNKEEKVEVKEKTRKGIVESVVQSTQVPKSQKKSSRYSSKYRGDTSVRGSVSRSTTSAPAYIPTIPAAAYVPTIPTVAPSRTTVNSGAGLKDADLGLEIISFDDPVNTVPSANLINEDFISSSTENALNNPVSLVKEATTEKPVSIIERIINSITAMTTTVPDTSKQTSTASTTESSSAILKLATKKSTKPDQTKLDTTSLTYPIGTVTYTTEKPTTIIERILSSLSAIQATDDTNSNQVGKDFNTISSPPTTPVSKVTKSSTSRISLPAQISTSINPLSVLDEISPDQVLQKRTIGKLLGILNGLLSTTESPQKLVVVTPKFSNFVTGAGVVVSDSTGTATPSISNTIPVSSTVPSTVAPSTSNTTPISSTIPSTVAPSISNTDPVSSTVSSTVPPSTFNTDPASSTATTQRPTTISMSTDTLPPLPLSDSVGTTNLDITPGPELFTSPINLPSSSLAGTTMPSGSQTNPIVESRLAQTTPPAQLQTATVSPTLPTTMEASGESTQTEASTQLDTQTPSDMVASTQTEATVPTTVALTTLNSDPPAQQDTSNTAALPLSLDDGVTSSLTESTTSTTFPSTTEAGLTGTTNIETLITYLSTIPSLQNFEVSPGSVSIFSANELSNLITTDDFSTVTIAGRSNFDVTATTDSTTTESGTTEASTDPIATTVIPEMATAAEGSTVSNDGTTEGATDTTNTDVSGTSTVQSSTPSVEGTSASATTVQDGTTSQNATGANALSVSSTENVTVANSTDQSGTVASSTESTQSSPIPSTSTTNVTTNDTSNQSSNNTSLANRSGKLLDLVDDPILNSIDVSTPSTTTSTTPDYFIFAVLNNNTILRKKPPTIPNKDTPYVIVGLFPNNTVVRKFPNGTLVPMEQIIRVRGFDIRENPPPLPEITSNQVTNDPGSSEDTISVETVDENTVPTVEANPLSLDNNNNSTSNDQGSATSTTSTTALPLQSTVGSTSSTTTIAPATTESGTIATNSAESSTVFESSLSTVDSTTVGQITNVATVTPSSTEASSTTSGTTAGTTTESSTSPDPTLPTLSELLNGRTLEALNSILNVTNTNTNSNTNYQTLKVNQIENSTESTTAGPTLTTEVTDMTMPPMTETTTFMTVTPAATTPQNQGPSRDPLPLSNTITESTTLLTSTTQAATPSSAPTQSTTTSTQAPTTQTTTRAPTTTQTVSSTTPRITSTPTSTVQSSTTTFPTVTFFPTFPTFITTLFPNLLRGTTQPPAITTTTTKAPTTVTEGETIAISASTSQPTTVVPPVRGRVRFIETTTGVPTTVRRRTPTTPRITTTPAITTRVTTTTTTTTTTSPTTTTTTTTTTPAPTTTRTTTTPTTTTTTIPTTTTQPTVADVVSRRSVQLSAASGTAVPLTTAAASSTVTPKLKQLTEQQKKDLETLTQLEKEQAALLQQLSFLTSLNFGGNRNGRNKESSNLANRVIQLAVDRDKTKTATTTTSKPAPQNIQDQLPPIEDANKKATPSIEDILKQYNLNGLNLAPASTTAAPSLPYGSSNDAILAALLKEQGISPPTPKTLADQIKEAGVFEETTTTRRPRPRTTTQRPPGRLMQGLNWLLNVLAPPPQPTRRPKPVKPKKAPVEQELLANSPTRLTPMVTSAPKPFSPNSLSQDDVQKLIKQLEEVRKDPKNAAALDFTQIKSLQNLINSDGAVEVASNGQHGTTSRVTTTQKSTTKRRKQKSTTTVAPTVSNIVDEEEEEEEFEATTARKPALPPLRLRPVPGLEEGNSDPFIRGNLITAAVNVTRAISGFLGTALQGAAQGFQSLLGSGSRLAQASSSRPG